MENWVRVVPYSDKFKTETVLVVKRTEKYVTLKEKNRDGTYSDRRYLIEGNWVYGRELFPTRKEALEHYIAARKAACETMERDLKKATARLKEVEELLAKEFPSGSS